MGTLHIALHFLLVRRQHDLVRYFDICKLIHDPLYAVNRPDTIVRKTAPCDIMMPNTSMLYCLLSELCPEFSVWVRLQTSCCPLSQRTILLLAVHQLFLYFLFTTIDVLFFLYPLLHVLF